MNEPFRIYPDFRLARFIDRPNRFIMKLKEPESGATLVAHVPNTGRMTEFLIANREFALLPTPHNKTQFRVIATRYQEQWVFLDTIRCNRIVEELLKKEQIPEITDIKTFRREVSWEDSRFDFQIIHQSGQRTWLEVKSVTLCHNGMALFPDAPTERGLKHIRAQSRLRQANPQDRVLTLYLILNGSASRFSFNAHTHDAYAQASIETGPRHLLAYRLPFIDPVSFNFDTLNAVPIDFVTPKTLSRDKGSYFMILFFSETVTHAIGALGPIRFEKGYYIYIGSAMNNLSKRMARHLGKIKKTHWHLDYLSVHASSIKSVPIRSTDPGLEQILVEAMSKTDLTPISGFGSSDSPHPAHLFYSSSDPLRNPQVNKILFDAYVREFIMPPHQP